jgi:hypothetical protein
MAQRLPKPAAAAVPPSASRLSPPKKPILPQPRTPKQSMLSSVPRDGRGGLAGALGGRAFGTLPRPTLRAGLAARLALSRPRRDSR